MTCVLINFLPKIAITISSLTISIEPRAMKYSETITSPWWTRVSPGGAWVVLNFIESALKCLEYIFSIVYNISFRLFFKPYPKSHILSKRRFIYLRQPEDAPSNAGQLLSKFLFKWTHMSACRQSGNPFSTIFMSIPFV